MKIWVVSREYAGIAEAGGVKNVATSLCETLLQLGHDVSLFIPFYGCTDAGNFQQYVENWIPPIQVNVAGQDTTVTFNAAKNNGLKILFICNPAFAEKKAVYCYTEEEERLNPNHRKGQGHEDALYLDVLFQKAVSALSLGAPNHVAPDIIHCQDASGALIPSFIDLYSNLHEKSREFWKDTKSVVTIHNAGPGYLHRFHDYNYAKFLTGLSDQELMLGQINGCVVPFLLASNHAQLTAVSPEYAREILEEKVDTAGLGRVLRERGKTIVGITNGIDWNHYNPTDTSVSKLPFAYDPIRGDLEGKYRTRQLFLKETAGSQHCSIPGIRKFGFLEENENSSTTYFVYHGRVVQQKGIDVLSRSARRLLEEGANLRFIFMGQGDRNLEEQLKAISQDFPGKAVYFQGYDRPLSRISIASADFSIFPSLYEPCGLEDYIAQIYGTLPIAHATGGLKKIIDDETGYLYSPDTDEKLYQSISSLMKIHNACPEIFRTMISYACRYVQQKYSWKSVVQDSYVALYRELLDQKKN